MDTFKDDDWILDATIIGMLVYTGWRVYSYLFNSLVGVAETTAWIISLCFLLFTEIGMLVWLHRAQPRANSPRQERVSSAMVWIDYAGSMILGLADIAQRNTIYNVDLSRIDFLLFIAPWLIVAINVAAWIDYRQHDSRQRLAKAERALKQAEGELEISARMGAVEELMANKEGLSRQLTPYYYKDMKDRVSGRTVAKFGREADKLPEYTPPPKLMPPAPKSLRERMANFILGSGVSYNGNGNHWEEENIQADTEEINPTNR